MRNIALPRLSGGKSLLAAYYFVPAFIPLLLLHGNIFPTDLIERRYHNFAMLSIVSMLVAPFIWRRIRRGEWILSDIGLDMRNFKSALRFYAVCSFGGIVLFTIVAMIVRPIRSNIDEETILLYSCVGSVLQEFLYRGYLMKIGKDLFENDAVNCAMNVFVFTIMHSIFGRTIEECFVIMGLILPAAIFFTVLYRRYPNLMLVSVAHIISNALGVYSGIFN